MASLMQSSHGPKKSHFIDKKTQVPVLVLVLELKTNFCGIKSSVFSRMYFVSLSLLTPLLLGASNFFA